MQGSDDYMESLQFDVNKIKDDSFFPFVLRNLAEKSSKGTYATVGAFLENCSAPDLDSLLRGISWAARAGKSPDELKASITQAMHEFEVTEEEKAQIQITAVDNVFGPHWSRTVAMIAVILSNGEGLDWKLEDQKTAQLRVTLFSLFIVLTILSKFTNKIKPNYRKLSFDLDTVFKNPLHELFDFTELGDPGRIKGLFKSYETLADVHDPRTKVNWAPAPDGTTTSPILDNGPPKTLDEIAKLWERRTKG